jgi:type I restriction enzyme R subunit
VTPDATHKDRFVLVDAVGITETDLIDVAPVDRRRAVGLDKLLNQVALGDRDHDVIASVAGRLARLNARLSNEERQALSALGGVSVSDLSHNIFQALDPDRQLDVARQQTGKDDPAAAEVEQAAAKLLDEALTPIDRAEFRQTLVDIHRSHEQVIDETSADRIIEAGHSKDATDRARSTIESFRKFIDDNKDEITALQILYSQPYGARQLTFQQIKEFADTISLPPRRWTPEALWNAYETLERNKVHGSTKTVLTNLVSLVRHALGQQDELVAFPDQVAERYTAWLHQQEQGGRTFTPEQMQWLVWIRDHIGDSLRITADDFEYTPFAEHGGIGGAYAAFGDHLTPLLEELNEELVA